LDGYGPEYWIWVRDFFWYASQPDNSVINALDDASLDHYEDPFGDTDLYKSFRAVWPLWNETSQKWEGGEFPSCTMVVYGNGNVHLYQKGGIWHLDQNALDSSHDTHGTIIGTARWDYGKIGVFGSATAFLCDGTNYINIPDDSDLDITDAVTVEAWIKPSRLDVWQSPLEKGAHNDWAYGFYIEPAGGNIGFEIGEEGSPATWAGAVAPVNSYLAVGKWTHIVGTADSATGKVYLYIDGYKRGEGSFSGQINTNSIPFQVGKRCDGGYFGGVIDEVRIYDRALSSSEIYSYYMANKPVQWLRVDGFSVDGIGTDIWIDGQYAGYNTAVSSVSQGTHTVEVNDWFFHPYYGYFVFDHFAYDSTTDYNNPMTLTVSKDTAVFADYYYYGW